jgi:hypothetical protein
MSRGGTTSRTEEYDEVTGVFFRKIDEVGFQLNIK